MHNRNNKSRRSLEETCEEQQRNWIAEAEECEGIPKNTCEALGGHYNECASACRNDPEATICTMQCVLVYEFKEEIKSTISQDRTSWFDGCNTCIVSEGELGGCTKKYCAPEIMREPKCLAFKEIKKKKKKKKIFF